MRRSGATARRGSPSMAAGKGGGYRGRVGWGVARPIVRRGLVGVSGKRRARGWGFETGQALTNGRASLVPAIGRQTGNSLRRPYLWQFTSGGSWTFDPQAIATHRIPHGGAYRLLMTRTLGCKWSTHVSDVGRLDRHGHQVGAGMAPHAQATRQGARSYDDEDHAIRQRQRGPSVLCRQSPVFGRGHRVEFRVGVPEA